MRSGGQRRSPPALGPWPRPTTSSHQCACVQWAGLTPSPPPCARKCKRPENAEGGEGTCVKGRARECSGRPWLLHEAPESLPGVGGGGDGRVIRLISGWSGLSAPPTRLLQFPAPHPRPHAQGMQPQILYQFAPNRHQTGTFARIVVKPESGLRFSAQRGRKALAECLLSACRRPQ